jgi:transcriptional regulator GlxA family with amidase domain
VLLLAETGLPNGREATIHSAYAPTLRRNYPAVRLRLEEVLIATGARKGFIMWGASASWHDLVLQRRRARRGGRAARKVVPLMRSPA